MSLRVALVIDGDQAGAKKATEDTVADIGKVQTAAGKAATPAKELPQAFKDTATEAGNAATKVEQVGSSAATAQTKIGDLRALAIGAVGGIAATLAAEAIGWASGAVTQAVSDYATNILSAGPQIEAALTAQAELVERIKGAFNDADDAASNYGANTPALLRFEQQNRLTDLNSAFDRGQDDLLSGGFFGSNAIQAGQGPAGSPLQQVVADFRAELAKGEADIIAFRNRVVEFAETLPENDPGRKYATALLEDTAKLAEVQTELARGNELMTGLSGNAEAAANALGGTAEQYTALGASAEAAITPLTTVNELLGSISKRPMPSGLGGMSTVNPDLGLGFASGGDTGAGRDDDVAGLVHRNEYVFDAAATRRIGVPTLEALRAGSLPGYASGGLVGRPSGAAGGSVQGAFSVVDELVQDLSILSGAVTDFASNLWETRDPLQALGSVIQSVSQSFLNSALGAVAGYADKAFSGMLNGAISSIFGGSQLQLGYQAGVMHTGGAPEAPSVTRWMPASLFANAPRLHQGLASDEFPTILQEGETVIPRGGRAAAGGTTVNYWNVETRRVPSWKAALRCPARPGAYRRRPGGTADGLSRRPGVSHPRVARFGRRARLAG